MFHQFIAAEPKRTTENRPPIEDDEPQQKKTHPFNRACVLSR